jgi:phosphoenolpyruvate carboxykinase (GTP)
MIDRIEGKAEGVENPVGITPQYGSLNWQGLNFSADQFEQITRFDKTLWGAELKLHDELFAKLAYHLPTALTDTRAKIEARLAA